MLKQYANCECELLTANASYSQSSSAVWKYFGFPINYSSTAHNVLDETKTVFWLSYTKVPCLVGNSVSPCEMASSEYVY